MSKKGPSQPTCVVCSRAPENKLLGAAALFSETPSLLTDDHD